MAKEVVHQRGLAIRVACAVFSISESCYRYEPKEDAENALIADWLIRLTDNHRNWGFGLCSEKAHEPLENTGSTTESTVINKMTTTRSKGLAKILRYNSCRSKAFRTTQRATHQIFDCVGLLKNNKCEAVNQS